MLMPKKNRIAIYELLFKEGVMVAKKDVHLAKHPELADKNVPNLHVMKAMQVRDCLGLHLESSCTVLQVRLCGTWVVEVHLMWTSASGRAVIW